MSRTEQNHNSSSEAFSLTVDQYGRLWLHTKLEGVAVAIDLAEKHAAFQIMAETMAENDFRYLPLRVHEKADNDDAMGS